MGGQLGSHLISDRWRCLELHGESGDEEMWMGLSYMLEAELVRFNDQFGAGGVKEKRCQDHVRYCSGNSMRLLRDCEMLLACPMVCGAPADE